MQRRTRYITEVYKEFISPIYELLEILNSNKDNEQIDKDTITCIAVQLSVILQELHDQALEMLNVSSDDIDEVNEFSEWITFWGYMFYFDAEQFRNMYSIEILQKMPECWNIIAKLVDSFLENECWEEPFSDCLFYFATTVVNNFEEKVELLSDCEWDEEFDEAMIELYESDKSALEKLDDALYEANYYFIDYLPYEE